jgi:hypothetical protein
MLTSSSEVQEIYFIIYIHHAARWDTHWDHPSEDCRKQFPVQSRACHQDQLMPFQAYHLVQLVTSLRCLRRHLVHRRMAIAVAVTLTEKVSKQQQQQHSWHAVFNFIITLCSLHSSAYRRAKLQLQDSRDKPLREL